MANIELAQVSNADYIRRVCLLAAKGSAASFVHHWYMLTAEPGSDGGAMLLRVYKRLMRAELYGEE